MSAIISYLSGEVPGGIFLLLLVLFVVNLIFIFARSSKLVSPRESIKKQAYASLIIVILYLIPWFFLSTLQPVKRILVMPIKTDAFREVGPASFEFNNYLQSRTRANLSPRYILHRWQWLYEIIEKDSLRYPSAWQAMALKLNPAIVIFPEKNTHDFVCIVKALDGDETVTKKYSVSADDGFEPLLKKIDDDFGILLESSKNTKVTEQKFIDAECAILRGEHDLALQILKTHTSLSADILRGEIYARKGLMKKIDRARAQYVPQKIKEFNLARKYFSRVIREKQDTPRVAFWLGRMALHMQDYTKAEIYLKNALMGDPDNSRIYLRLSYLHPNRLKELGYDDRVAILARAVELDPGFRLAVRELADEYFMSGSGGRSAKETALARSVLENYLRLKKDDPQILSLQASLYLKTSAFDQALSIYETLYKRFPDDSNSSYNLGAAYFMKKEYAKALDYFLQAINIDQNPDAYLYAGITYQRMGKNALALKYYRKRVRLKSGDDDRYAKEAMKGIRAILADSLKGTKNELQSDLPQSTAKNQ